MKKKQEKNIIPVVVRCYACQMLHLPHLYLLEDVFIAKLATSALGNVTRPSGASVPSVRNIKETIYLCEKHFKSFITERKFPSRPLGLKKNQKLYRFDELTGHLTEVKDV